MLQVVAIKLRLSAINSGVLALVATLVIWSSYFVALRSGAQSPLTSFDMALLRFVLPALLLLPIIYRSRVKIAQVKKRYLLGIMVGAGLPFYLLSVIASGNVQAVIGSLLVPGVAPVFVTIIAVLFYRQRLAKRKLLGLSAVLLGIVILMAQSDSAATNSALLGSTLYIVAAACWAVYTVSVKLAKLSGIETAAILNISAASVLLLVAPLGILQTNISAVPWQQILPQLVVMGGFCGLVAVITYGHAINKLGAELSACWGALTPVLVAILAFSILNEALDITTVVAMLVITAGVVCANFKAK
ncbi:MAG: DMT family transporter [Pseudomonadales bacterium]|nr:DMT family transporter [Pseudomonadales bacterium]NRA15090.1 DMT family transporter [Oceanospirillaceae bacterium]